MGKLAPVAMAAGLAALGCSSSTVNDSGASGGAGSGGAAGASGASSGGGASSTGGGSAGQDAGSGGGASSSLVLCEKAAECLGLCGATLAKCGSLGFCVCWPTGGCVPGSVATCPVGMTCEKQGYYCTPSLGKVPAAKCGQNQNCQPGELCDTATGACRTVCQTAPDAGPADNFATGWGWCK